LKWFLFSFADDARIVAIQEPGKLVPNESIQESKAENLQGGETLLAQDGVDELTEEFVQEEDLGANGSCIDNGGAVHEGENMSVHGNHANLEHSETESEYSCGINCFHQLL